MKIMYIIVLLISIASIQSTIRWIAMPITYVNSDTLFDRVVVLYLQEIFGRYKNRTRYKHHTTGVLIKQNLVLTSFNAFRQFTSQGDSMKKMRLEYLGGRAIGEDGSYSYSVHREGGYIYVKCGRQVIPSDPRSRPVHMRHAHHSPAHDLMVLRISTSVRFINPVPPVRDNFIGFENQVKQDFAPIRTILAKPGDEMFRDEMKFASLGHESDYQIYNKRSNYRSLRAGEFGDIVDCEEWLPREWGHFICLANSEDYPGLAAGAVLFSDVKLFGIGAFMLKKGKDSILVFTDVRPYWHLLHRTCSEQDKGL